MEKLTSSSRAVLLVLLLLLAPWSAQAAGSLEYPVKAAYLSKFGLFVQWPPGAFTAPASPLNLCLLGDDPFGEALDSAANGQRIGTHAIAVRRLKTVGHDSGCHILYIAAEAPNRSQVLDSMQGSAVLTVTDGAQQGGTGIIHFVVMNNRVRFDIDNEQAARSGLVISSKLLQLALNVKPRH